LYRSRSLQQQVCDKVCLASCRQLGARAAPISASSPCVAQATSMVLWKSYHHRLGLIYNQLTLRIWHTLRKLCRCQRVRLGACDQRAVLLVARRCQCTFQDHHALCIADRIPLKLHATYVVVNLCFILRVLLRVRQFEGARLKHCSHPFVPGQTNLTEPIHSLVGSDCAIQSLQ
jgi:hypothetical protein